MSTTELLVEYIILGSVADIWVLLITLAVIPYIQIDWTRLIDLVEKSSTIFLVVFLSMTYTLGGLVNFSAQNLFDHIQKKQRDETFKQTVKQPYEKVRGSIYHNAPPDVMARFRSDGHIIRVSRGNILNFSLIATSLLLYIYKYPVQAGIGIGLGTIFAVLSCLQWMRRYKTNYREMADEYLAIKAETITNQNKEK